MSDLINETSQQFNAMIPQLNSGDVLDHAEYLRRYHAAPEKLTAERINGTVFLMNAQCLQLGAEQHGNPHALLVGWLFTYAMHDPSLVVSDNPTLFLDADNDPQPDACLYRVGGNTSLRDGYLVGPPELIVEVAGSSASYDFGEKRTVYESAGVLEYLVFETAQGRLEWWHNENGKFRDVIRGDGVLKSHHFPGLWLDRLALHSRDSRRLIETLRGGMTESNL